MILKYAEDFEDIAFALKHLREKVKIVSIETGLELEVDEGCIKGYNDVLEYILKTEKCSIKDINRIKTTKEKVDTDHSFLSYISLYNTLKDLILKPNLKNISYIEDMVTKYNCQYLLFNLLKIQVGKIINIENLEGSDNLYVETVDFGTQTQIVSGLRTFYKKEDLLNRKCLFITNIKKSKIMNKESNGMILCAKNGETVEVLFVDDAIDIGTTAYIKNSDFFRNLQVGYIDLKKNFYKSLFNKLSIRDHFVCYDRDEILLKDLNVTTNLKEGTVG